MSVLISSIPSVWLISGTRFTDKDKGCSGTPGREISPLARPLWRCVQIYMWSDEDSFNEAHFKLPQRESGLSKEVGNTEVNSTAGKTVANIRKVKRLEVLRDWHVLLHVALGVHELTPTTLCSSCMNRNNCLLRDYGNVVYCPCPWATKESSHGTKELPVLVFKARHLSGSAFCTGRWDGFP